MTLRQVWILSPTIAEQMGISKVQKVQNTTAFCFHHLVFLWILSMKSDPAFLNSIDLSYRLQVQRNEQQNISEQPDRCLHSQDRSNDGF